MTRDEVVEKMRARAGAHQSVVATVLSLARYQDLPDDIPSELCGRMVGDVGLWVRAIEGGSVRVP